MAITSNPVSNQSYAEDPNSISARWGVTAYEYTINGKQVDLQDLMVTVAENRAVAIEGEVAPQATRIRNRNAKLDRYGAALGVMTEYQAKFDDDDKSDARKEAITDADTVALLKELNSGWAANPTKAQTEGIIQILKSAIDGMNNEAQLDMSRLQQLVDRRDESYSTATNLMTSISDTRSNLIRNL